MDKLDKALRQFSSTLEAWLECQKNWLFLESIFSASDIQRQLPAESKAFLQVGRLSVWPAPAKIPAYMPLHAMEFLLSAHQSWYTRLLWSKAYVLQG